VTGRNQVQIYEWLSAKGIRIEAPRWFIESSTNETIKHAIAHVAKTCLRTRTPLTGDGVLMGFTEVAEHHFFCDACLPHALDVSLDPTQAGNLFRGLHGLQRTSRLVEHAASTFHVLTATEYPALHAAIVNDVEPHLRRELDNRIEHPLYEQAHVAVRLELDALVARLPYDPQAALEEAILLAARWRFVEFQYNDLFERALKEHSDPVKRLGACMLNSVRRAGQAHDVVERLIHENAALAAELPSLGEILRTWADVFDEALNDTAPTFFASGGLPLGLTSIPRTAVRWMVWHGVRAHHHHWGIGELPKVLLEYIAYSCRTSELSGNVEILDTPYEPLCEEAWLTANALWKDHMNQRRDEVLYSHPGEAILAAARL
jgi:hypothetical protein